VVELVFAGALRVFGQIERRARCRATDLVRQVSVPSSELLDDTAHGVARR
jgi:hypothetical protein